MYINRFAKNKRILYSAFPRELELLNPTIRTAVLLYPVYTRRVRGFRKTEQCVAASEARLLISDDGRTQGRC